jgi:hypothetical protein
VEHLNRCDLENTARRLLAWDPDPVVRLRLLRDVLSLPETNLELREAKLALSEAGQVRALAAEQRPNGGWGRFHSRDSHSRQKIVTTEIGIERALALGLEADSLILTRAKEHLLALQTGRQPFPDREEKQLRWAEGKRLFLSASLARIEPDYPALQPVRAEWLAVARRSLASGSYQEQAEDQARLELSGYPASGSFLTIRSRYALILLGSGRERLTYRDERALLDYLWSHPQGIGYLSVPLSQPPDIEQAGRLDRWLTSLELLAGLFPLWTDFGAPAIAWLLEQRRLDGLWDLGPRPMDSWVLPYSASWRVPGIRQLDWTTRMLALLCAYSVNIEMENEYG